MTRKTIVTIGVAALVVLAAAATLAAGLGTVGADAPGESNGDRSIQVSATGQATAAPDQALVRVEVTASGDNPAAVRDDLAAGTEELRSALDELGVDYETVSYSLSEERRAEERERAPYRGEHEFEVTLEDPDATGSVVDAAADANASVQRVALTLSDDRREDLRDDAITNAMDDARQQASTIASAGDLTADDVHSVQASQQRYRPAAYEMAAAGDGGGGGTSIDAGDVSVSYRVQVTYNASAA
ncbi:MAG: SIMPL domain-containing protein [Haloarculaceae archaeon]